jgi:diguanylate cyclase (GGDEF)-like protein/PAS domain S-box-containing protein
VTRLLVVTVTGAAFIGLRSAGWLGTAPLVVIIAILVAGGFFSEMTFQTARARQGFGWLIVLPLAVVSVVIYSIGWGPALTIGYLYPLGEAFRLKRPPPPMPVFATLAVGLAVGEVLVEENVVHSYVPTPYAHGLAALGLLGLFAVYQMLVSAKTSTERANAALARREESFRLLFTNHPEPMWVYDEHSLEILAVNDAAVERYGYSVQDFLTMRITNLRPTEELPRLAEDLAGPRGPFATSSGWHHVLADGTVIDVEISSHRTDYLGRDAVLVSAFDVTERNRLEARLRHQAYHDDLTGLPNRAYLTEQLEELETTAYGAGHAIAVLVIDLDDFYQLNSAMGFSVGDELLRTVAGELRALDDHTVARVGADEFAVVALVDGESALVQTEQLAGELHQRLTRPIHLDELTLTIETSIGAAIGPFPPNTSVSLLSVAESNLRRAKNSLARVATSDVRDGEPYEEHLAVVAELRYAIENGDLCLHYQPKVDLATGLVTGVEALVRWEHPRRGLLPPAAFVPLAERTGLIGPLTRFVLGEAIAQVARWRAEGLDLSMSVNLGAANLEDPALPEYVSGLLAGSGLEARQLVLEITEGVVMSESERTTSVVKQLDAAGVELSIDDFGTAHSSLSRLKTLPITEIKLDKAFVTHMDAGWYDVTIVRSSINLGHELGLRVVAEGIETEAVADHLRRLGCDVGQGFWLAHPMPVPAVTNWLRATRTHTAAAQETRSPA